MTDNIKMVSVCMITYNHEKYIRQAIDSILMQVTYFEYELVIANDNSPDKTHEIISEYKSQHPKGNLIKYIYNEINVGPIQNFLIAVNSCTGKYIALCEGDDYWTDALKLQKQVDFLETNGDFNFSMGKVEFLNTRNNKIEVGGNPKFKSKDNSYKLKDYIKYPFSQTSSFLFRNSTEKLPEWFKKVHAGDQSIVVVKTGNGKIKYHNDLFSVYRIHEKSISRTVQYDIYENFLQTINSWKEHLGKDYYSVLNLLRYRVKQYILLGKCRFLPCTIFYKLKIKLISLVLYFV